MHSRYRSKIIPTSQEHSHNSPKGLLSGHGSEYAWPVKCKDDDRCSQLHPVRFAVLITASVALTPSPTCGEKLDSRWNTTSTRSWRRPVSPRQRQIDDTVLKLSFLQAECSASFPMDDTTPKLLSLEGSVNINGQSSTTSLVMTRILFAAKPVNRLGKTDENELTGN